jgi:hypothetical protein
VILGRFVRVGSLAMTAALTAALWPVAGARAAFPGRNGLITFSASVQINSKFVRAAYG